VGMGYSSGLMEVNMKVNGRTVCLMGKVFASGPMAENMRENGSRACLTERENIDILMGECTGVGGKMAAT